MTDLSQAQVRERIEQSLARRHRKEKLFRGLGIASIAFGVLAVLVLFTDIISKGSGAFVQTAVQLEVTYDAAELGIDTVDEESLTWANFTGVVREALRERFPDVSGRSEKRELYSLVSTGAPFTLRDRLAANPELLGKTEKVWFAADDDVDTFYKSLDDSAGGFRGRTSERMAGWVEQLAESGELKKRFNTTFFTNGDSREPEQAGIRAALVGSLLTLLVTLALSFPIGVAAAIYLEEFAPRNRWTDLIEVNINNLAAVPSIVFGLLGLAIFINFFELPRSAPLVGGLVLTLMTLPTIIISSRAALKSVPPSIREAAMGMGASRMQVVLHHVLPLAMPGMLTGAIIGMAQALGETAPLLMIGMVAFIVDVPGGVTDPATVLPVQIFLWADSPERAFVEKTSAAIMVLLSVLIVMNASAVWLRKKLERRW
ncbi:phosphate ABC transporter permease PstA [Microbulbifer yueqingensis]|uniref:Phosphate transport system permease protein PstA n=1 Tax=Microbulbifer yueqingensis TaxID=658219 RepID=A0A1G9BNW3_9GAMM|nr:phosphate ABC transporter permease PstA [Microbulbifer yueqingensis]SDK40950.1 phosphate ABC transporter membrane protein 2, PhoT family [Microbulbifer yueqingensis]